MNTARELRSYLWNWHNQNIAQYFSKSYDVWFHSNWTESIFNFPANEKESKLDSKIWKSKTFIRKLSLLLDFYSKVLKDYRNRQGRIPLAVREEVEEMIILFIKLTLQATSKNINNTFASFTRPNRRNVFETEDNGRVYGGRPTIYERNRQFDTRDTYVLVVNRKLGAKTKTKGAKN